MENHLQDKVEYSMYHLKLSSVSFTAPARVSFWTHPTSAVQQQKVWSSLPGLRCVAGL